jgi:hypothetical protein
VRIKAEEESLYVSSQFKNYQKSFNDIGYIHFDKARYINPVL